MRQEKGIEFEDFSAGLDKYNDASLVEKSGLTDAENIRFIGKGRIKRRNGQELFSSSGVAPFMPDQNDIVGRCLIPYLRKNIGSTNKTVIAHPLALIKNHVYYAQDGTALTKSVLYGNTNAEAYFAWDDFTATIDAKAKAVGFGFLDNMIFLGSAFSKQWKHKSNQYIDQSYPFGYYLKILSAVDDNTEFTKGETVNIFDEGSTLVATAKVGYACQAPQNPDDTYDNHLFVYNLTDSDLTNDTWWAEGVSSGATGTLKLHEAEAQRGIVLEYGEGIESPSYWYARKWGINAPTDTLTITDQVEASLVEQGTYSVRYTFIRYTGGALSSGDNPKLSGGTMISESAPSTAQTFVVTTDFVEKLRYSAWQVSPDPQVTHIRVYRTDGSLEAAGETPVAQDFHYVMDIPIAGGSTYDDNLSVEELQLLVGEGNTIATENFHAFGDNNEYSGFAIEIANNRVIVGGNRNNPTKLYMSQQNALHKYSEYLTDVLDINDGYGESINAIKFWNNTVYIFMENSVYQLTNTTGLLGDQVDSFRNVTRGLGCVTRNGVLDMGDYLLVMTERGLLPFDGVNFGKVPLTQKVNDILGKHLVDAQMIKTDENIIIITETSRTFNAMIVIKYSDSSFAISLDVLNANLSVFEQIGWIPNLVNYNNIVDDSVFILGLQRFLDGTTPYYYLMKHDLDGENKDLDYADPSNVQEYPIVARISPQVLDFGAFYAGILEKLVAYIGISGASDSTRNAPTGEWLAKIYVNYADDGSAERYHEIKLMPDYKRNKTTTGASKTPVDPIQRKWKIEAYTSGEKKIYGGNLGTYRNPMTLLADFQQFLFSGSLPVEARGRTWKIVFVYQSDNNFEFNSFAVKFVVEEDK